MSRAQRSLEWTPLLFSGGLAFLLFALFIALPFGEPPMRVGMLIQQQGATELGAANLVTAVVLGYRGLDTLGELAILFASATAAGLVLSTRQGVEGESSAPVAPLLGEIFDSAVTLLMPLLLLLGFYIILHGHLTPGGGFQGGVLLAIALYLPSMARRGRMAVSHTVIRLVEGGAGGAFVVIGLLALFQGMQFLTPLLQPGEIGALLSAGTLPLLYLAVGLKVGAELAALLLHLTGDAS